MVRARTLGIAVLLIAVPLAGCTSPSPRPPPTGPTAFDTVEKGNDSGIETRETFVVRNISAWTDLWIEHRPETDDHPKPPSVDFDERMVLAIFAGASPASCREAEITNVTGLPGGTLRVEGALTEAGDERCTEQTRAPYHIVATDRYDAEVTFAVDEPEDEGRPLTAKPPACWYLQAWQQPGLYEAAGEAANGSEVRSVQRPLGPSLAVDHPDLPLEPGELALDEVSHVAPSGQRSRFLQITLAPADGDDHAHLRALTWAEDTPEEVADLARAFLTNTTSASEERIEDWASELEQTRNETQEFPPTRPIVDRPPDAKSDGYAYNLTIDVGGVLELGSLAESLDEQWRRIDGEPRPYRLIWSWDANWTGAATQWSLDFRLPTRVLATTVNGTGFFVDVSATDKVFVYAEGELDTPPDRWVQEGFENLGLPEPTEEGSSPGGRVC